MSSQNSLLIAVMAVIVLGVAFIVYKFIRSIIERRAYEREELPDLYAAESEDVILPDIEESGFSQPAIDDFDEDEDIYSESSELRERGLR